MGGGPTSGDSLSGEALVERWGSWASDGEEAAKALVGSFLRARRTRLAFGQPGRPSAFQSFFLLES